jgi:ATP-dependent DNA helicase DinG
VMVAALRSANLPWKILAQGESGRSDLRDTFKADRDSVLVGTKSFFEGLDVQGDACRLVVIDKLPFDPPGDPVEDAVGALASERSGGLSPFMVRSLPRACALLAQAAGRLVRSPTDRGALMLLDNRVLQNSAMGAAARRALPPFPLSRDVRDIARHLAGEKLALAPLAVPMLVNGRATGAVEPEAIPLRRRSAS